MTYFSLRPFARRLVDAASGLSQLIWQAGFRFLGVVFPAPVKRFSSEGQQRVLVISPHPDDEILSCGGTIGLHLAAGDSVCVLYVTDGRKSKALNLPPEEMALVRHREAAAASAAWGFKMDWLGFPEDRWDPEALFSALLSRSNDTPPDLVYLPSGMDYHPEHLRTAEVLAAWTARLPGLAVRIYPTQVPLTPGLVNLVADVSGFEMILENTTAQYRSQVGNFSRMIRLRRYAALRFRCGRLAEPFWEITGAQYANLRKVPRKPTRTYFGLRHWAFTDPLAYLRGGALRSRYREYTCES